MSKNQMSGNPTLQELVDKSFGLVSLVSVSARNWCYLCGRIERVETGEIVEIAKLHAVFMQVVEKVLG